MSFGLIYPLGYNCKHIPKESYFPFILEEWSCSLTQQTIWYGPYIRYFNTCLCTQQSTLQLSLEVFTIWPSTVEQCCCTKLFQEKNAEGERDWLVHYNVIMEHYNAIMGHYNVRSKIHVCVCKALDKSTIRIQMSKLRAVIPILQHLGLTTVKRSTNNNFHRKYNCGKWGLLVLMPEARIMVPCGVTEKALPVRYIVSSVFLCYSCDGANSYGAIQQCFPSALNLTRIGYGPTHETLNRNG
jgi:hypothetical protein